MNRILLIDTDNLLHRAHHVTALRDVPIRSCGGFPTNIVAKAASMLGRLLDDTRPNRVIFGLDGGCNHRRAFYPDYKANRKPKADPLVKQIPLMYEFIRDSGMEYVYRAGQEADDLLMSLATAAKGRNGVEILLATQDKDYAQVVGENVVWLCPSKMMWERCTAETVKADFGVPPSQMARYLALIGDTADNTPGIEGIGPKNAVALLSTDPDDDQLIDLLAARKSWARERAAEELALNFRLIRPNLIAGLRPESGSNLQRVIERHTELNCLEAANLWSMMVAQFARPGVTQLPAAVSADDPTPTALPVASAASPRGKQAELSFH